MVSSPVRVKILQDYVIESNNYVCISLASICASICMRPMVDHSGLSLRVF